MSKRNAISKSRAKFNVNGFGNERYAFVKLEIERSVCSQER
jgi:hypothetical protein